MNHPTKIVTTIGSMEKEDERPGARKGDAVAKCWRGKYKFGDCEPLNPFTM